LPDKKELTEEARMKKRDTSKLAFILVVSLVFIFIPVSFSQPREQMVKVVVAPDHPDWEYKLGENVKFKISVLQYGNPLSNVTMRYEIMPEKMEPIKSGTLVLKEGQVTVNGGTMKMPGFLQCWAYATVDGKEYSGLAAAGFEPLKIQPTTELPKDFVEFWEKAKAEAAKIPLDAKMTLLSERSNEAVNVYQVSFQSFREGSRIYGILCVPKKEGKYPALLRVPGAGIRPYSGDAATARKGIITLEIGIHGIPVTMDPAVYADLFNGALNEYWFSNLDDRDHYYYKRVYLGCVRAVDFIFSLAQFDGEKLAVTGGSQGGALSIITTALDSRVKWLAPIYPALCDLSAYLSSRAGGWPHMFDKKNSAFNAKKDKIETSKYYDVVNFARLVKVPGYYSWGFNDTVCPPTSMFAAYNVITAAKKLLLIQDTGHWTYPGQVEKVEAWLASVLVGEGSEARK
jgi:cephalosporin-C deacetylase-like acetyl esterase